jgi:mRNA export factor
MFATNSVVGNTIDLELPGELEQSITSINWHPSHDYIIASSWDHMVRCWEVKDSHEGPRGEARAASTHTAPVLSSCFSSDGNKVFSGDCNKQVICWDLVSNQSMPLDGNNPIHESPVAVVQYLSDKNLLMTGSWDKTIKYWDGRSQGPVLTVQLPDKLFCANAKADLLVAGCANRKIQIYNLKNPVTPYSTIDSPLKFQTRCVSAFIDHKGFAVGSIEGRVAIHHVDPNEQNKNFAFKCHRDPNSQNIYAVNAIDYHPRYGTFATCGSDGNILFWDKESKSRLKSLPKYDLPITTGKFNHNGNYFGYSSCYDWSRGLEGFKETKQLGFKTRIFIHPVTDKEIRPKRFETGFF